jgi:hypothetical protein
MRPNRLIGLGRLLTTALVALAAACGSQGDNGRRGAAKQNSAERNRTVLVDLCALARHPERFNGRRVRLRAMFVPNIESADLTSPACMERPWDGRIGVVWDREPDSSRIFVASMEANRRSTASRPLAAEGEFEGIVHAQPLRAPVNVSDFGPMPPNLAVLEVVKVDDVRLVALPSRQPAEMSPATGPVTNAEH